MPTIITSPTGRTIYFGTGGSVPTGKIIDVNGDGLPDIVYTTGTITPSGTDPGAEVWINNGSSGWTQNTSWSFPIVSTSGGIQYTFNMDSHNVRFVDVNSDGLMDVIVDANGDLTPTASPKTAVYINTGSGWVETPSWQLPTIYTSTGGTNYTVSFNQTVSGVQNNPVRFVDVNNDGRPDIVYATGCAGSTCLGLKSTVAINTGTGWYVDPAWQLPTIPGGTAPNNVSNLANTNGGGGPLIMDVNGDGLPDILEPAAATAACGFTAGGYFKNTGAGWVFDSCWDHANFPTYSSQLVDINNDGLPDVVNGPGIYSASSTVFLNNGAGWTPTTHWTFPLLASLACGVNTTFTFMEVAASCSYDFDGNTRVVDFNGETRGLEEDQVDRQV